MRLDALIEGFVVRRLQLSPVVLGARRAAGAGTFAVDVEPRLWYWGVTDRAGYIGLLLECPSECHQDPFEQRNLTGTRELIEQRAATTKLRSPRSPSGSHPGGA